jgi:hypothetical protein
VRIAAPTAAHAEPAVAVLTPTSPTAQARAVEPKPVQLAMTEAAPSSPAAGASDQQQAATPPGPRPAAPLPGEAPPAGPERKWGPGSVINPEAAKVVEGTVNMIKWTYPSSEIWVREATSGQVVLVNTDGTGGLFSAGVTRETIKPGMTITVKGYAARDGSRLFADPGEMVSGGKPLAAAATAGLPELVSRRLAVCGEMPMSIFHLGEGPQDPGAIKAAVNAWRADCEAKLGKAGG